MGQLICTACGKQLNKDTVKCPLCGCHYFHRPQAEELGAYYQRAFDMRMEGQFSQAIRVYQDILAVSPDQTEAHRGIAYARYGVIWKSNGEAPVPEAEEEISEAAAPEYEEEELAFHPCLIPSLQFMREEPFLEDPDYLQARDGLNLTQQLEIEEDALPIHQMQEEILEMADSRPAYDIFLCYNPQTQSEETHRKVREMDIFLREEGYRVYLQDRLAQAESPEAVITYALWTAPVMIVVGAEEIDFRTPEVAQLWHRFRYMMSMSSKLVIPVYQGISPGNLPSEFSMMPCMDYSVIGFSNRLLRTIDKQFRKPEPNLQEDNRTVTRLIRSARTFLSLENYKQAFAIYQELYNRFPDHYEGWWGMIVSKTSGFTETHLDQKELNDWYRCARLLARESPEFAAEEPQFIAYKKRVYGGTVLKERQNVLDMVDRVNGTIREIHQASSELEETLARSKKQYNDANKEMNYQLRKNESEQDELRARSAMCRRIIIAGILISTGGIALVHDASSTLTPALVFLGFMIIIMGIMILKVGHVGENLQRLEEEARDISRKQAHYKKKYMEYKEAQAQTLENNRYEERRMQAFTLAASEWLDVDDDAMFGNILAEEMQGTGLVFNTHPELVTRRMELNNMFQQLFQ